MWKMLCRFSVQHLRCFSSQLSAQVIFSADSKSSFIEKVNRMKVAYPSTKTMSKRAAVLIPFVSVDGEASLLFTARSRQLRNHRGEICYPGGKFDDTSDSTILDAALRETEEELGINRSLFDVWAELPPLPSRDNKTAVTPVVAMLKEPFDVTKLKVNSAEVSEVFTCTLKDLCEPRNQGYTQFRSGYVIPVYFGNAVEGFKSTTPKIWGLTAGITHQVLTVLVPKMYKLKLKLLPKITVKP